MVASAEHTITAAPSQPMAQIERLAREVLPALQAHEVKTVPAAEEVLA